MFNLKSQILKSQISNLKFEISDSTLRINLWCVLVLTIVAAMFGHGHTALAQETEPAAVQDARESLGRTRFPWYDPQADAPRPVRAQPPQDDTANRASNWQSTPITAPAMPNLGIW